MQRTAPPTLFSRSLTLSSLSMFVGGIKT